MLTHHLCKLAALALVGLAVVTLIGPVLAVLGVLFAFAVIGWLACLAYYGVRQALGGRDFHKELSSARDAVCAAGRRGRRLVTVGLPWLGARLTACRARLHRASEAVRGYAPAVTGVLRETLCGAVVGAMLGLMANLQAPGPNYFVLIGGLSGAAAGLGVGLLKRRPLPEARPSSWRT
jgi:hypothetical protein